MKPPSATAGTTESSDWLTLGMPHLWMPYTQMLTAPPPIPVVATEDVYLILEDGTRLIDGLASWWTACHGYNHPTIREAVETQLRTMPHVMLGGIVHESALRLAARLAGLLPGDLEHVFFSDSGSVAVEVAMKMAVQYWLNQGVTGRTKFVSFRHAYHGDTTGAMSVCDPVNSMHAHFGGFLLEQFVQDLPQSHEQEREFDAFLGEFRQEIAAVIVEPLVQGAGGMKFHSPDCLAFLRRACDRHGLLLVADELATGFGRTGTMFACEQAEVVPDIICLGKALTGGTMGLAATVASRRVYDQFLSNESTHAFMHGPTFMANPLACAAALASLDLFDREPRLSQVAAIEEGLLASLGGCRDLPGVVDVRCKGAIGVIQVDRLHSLERLGDSFIALGVWARPFANMFYVTPPLTISPSQLSTLGDALARTVTDWSTWK
jgi:adenosylmethionine-8-amino-7-oxononanoate aminotransferase